MMASNYDEECTKAVCKIVPKINMNIINEIIEQTPIISDVRKEFYKEMLNHRKVLIIDRAYRCCIEKKFDEEALNRIKNGVQISEDFLRKNLSKLEEYEKKYPTLYSLVVNESLSNFNKNTPSSIGWG